MKISESTHASFLDSVPGQRRRSTEARENTPTDFQSLSMPSILALTEANHPARESFLSALSQSLKNGLYTCEPEQVADAILTRGLDTEAPVEQ
ncbi:MAG: hypothetical protein SGI92_01640 [Bryobacteraceae bacterium]|nr:hypothetical protein [Bryobacteraceae bacterium]